MKKIPINCKKHPNFFAFVDDEDFEKVRIFKWYLLDSNKNGKLFYAVKNQGKDGIRMLHRFIFGLVDPNMRIDHKNGNGLDCRRKNLRPATWKQNIWNRKFINNKTGYVGVYKIKNLYQASIRINGRNKSLGYFYTAKEASKIRNRAAKELYGEFYRD